MSSITFFLIPIGLIATLIVLGVGIYSLARGGAFARENGNKLMRLRVFAQALTIGVIVVFLLLIGRGPGS